MSSSSKWYWWADELAADGTLIIMSILSNGTKHLSSQQLHHISPFPGYVKFGLATGPDLLIKSTWASLFSADITITLPTYHFLAYSLRMYWPGFGNTMSGADSTIYIPILSTCLCLCLAIYCALTVFPHSWAQIHGMMLYLIWSLHLEN